MSLKPFVFFAFATLCTAAVLAQTPEPKRGFDTFSFVFNDGGYLGVQTIEVTKDNFSRFGLRDVRGVAVEKVIDGSPAAAAGIQAGDVIVSFNGEPITSSRKLTRLLGEVSPDHTAKIVVARGGNERELSVVVGKRPMPKWDDAGFNFKFPDNFPNIEVPNFRIPQVQPMPKIDVMPDLPNWNGGDFVWHIGGGRRIGIGVIPLTKQLAEHFGVDGGALVNDVRPDSPAAKAGLKAGDVIVEIDGRAVKGDGDIVRAINEKKEGEIALIIVRNGARQTLKVTPEPVKDEFIIEGPTPGIPGRINVAPPKPGTMAAPLDQFLVRGRII